MLNLFRKPRPARRSKQLRRRFFEPLETRSVMAADAVEIFVANTGDDWNAGTADAPFETIRRALDAAKPGDTITLRNGVYEGGINIDIDNLTIRSAPGEWAVVESPLTQFTDGRANSVFRYNFDVQGGKLENLEIQGGYYYGVMFWDWWDSNWDEGSTHVGPSGITLDGVKIHDTGVDAVKITPGANNISILNSEIYNAGRRTTQSADGIDNNNGDNLIVRGNYIYDIPGIGILTAGGAQDALIERNLIEDVQGAGIAVGYYSETEWMEPAENPNRFGSLRDVVRNNIVVNAGQAGLGIYAADSPQLYNNTLINPATEAQAPIQFGGINMWVNDVDWNVHVAGHNPVVVNNIITVAPGNHTRMVDIRYQSYTGELTLDHNLYSDQDLDAALFINRNELGDDAGEVYLAAWRAQNGFDQNSLLADPLLGADYHLLAGSPAIGRALSLAGLTHDFDGNPRFGDPPGEANPPQPDADPPGVADPPGEDIGADEFNAGINRATPPASFGAPTLEIAARAYHDYEGQSLLVKVLRHGQTTDTVSVDFATLGGSAQAGVDFTAVNGTLTFLPGETEKTVSVSLLQDAGAEGDEHFLFTLSNAITDGTLPVRLGRQSSASMTVDDDEVPVTLNYRTLWVGNDGSDVTGDGSAAKPWKSLQHAANNVGPGDFVIVKPGEYEGMNITTDGKVDARIVFHAMAGVTINDPNPENLQDGINLEGADFVTVEGFHVVGMPRAGIRSVLNTGAEIRGNSVDDNEWWGILTGWSYDLLVEGNVASRSHREHGIYISNSSDDGVIRNNIVWGNHSSGIQFNADAYLAGDGVHSRNVVEGNVIYDNGVGGGGAINLDGFQDGVVQNNLLYDNHGTGLVLYVGFAADSSTNNLVTNNTIVMAEDARWAVLLWNGSSGNTLVNNIFLNKNPNRGTYTIEHGSEPALSDYNIVEDSFQIDGANTNFAAWQAFSGGMDSHSLFADVHDLFVNPAAGEFRLKSGAEGVAVGDPFHAPATDLYGNARLGAVDIGAIEQGQFASTIEFDWGNYIAYEDGGMAVVSVTRSGNLQQTVEVDYQTAAGTAQVGVDYDEAFGTLVFKPGVTKKTFLVFVQNDSAIEPRESISLTLGTPRLVGDPFVGDPFVGDPFVGDPTGLTPQLGRANATLNIVSDDKWSPGSFELSQSVYQVNEHDGVATITIKRVGGSSGEATVDFATGPWATPQQPTWIKKHTDLLYPTDTDDPATAGDDYTPVAMQVSFADGETQKTVVIPILDDAWFEKDEGLSVSLANPTNGSKLGVQSTAKVKIVNDEVKLPGKFQFANAAISVTEGTPTVNVTIDRVDGGNVAAGVRLYITGAGNGSVGSAWAPSDFGSVPELILFAPGEMHKTISIPIVDDTQTESLEAFSLQLYSPLNDATIGVPSKTVVTIQDNESTIYFYSPDGSTFQAGEGDGVMHVKLVRQGATFTAASVRVKTSDWGSAVAGADYTGFDQIVNFAPGESSKTIAIPIVNDTLMEAKESFSVSMSNVVGAAQGSWSWAGYINDNDVAASPGKFELTASALTVLENAGQLVVTVNRVGGSDGTVSVQYSTSDGAAGVSSSQTAWAGSAYSSKSGTLTFAPGETSKTFSVPITDNTSASVDKYFTVKLANAAGGAQLGAVTKAAVKIQENDSAIRFLTSSYTGKEGTGPVKITLVRDGSSVGQASIDLVLSGWGATPGVDYLGPATNKIVFEDGETTKTFDLEIVDDLFKESDESLGLQLKNAVGAQLGYSLYGSVKIQDND